MKKGIKILLIVLGALVGLTILLAVIGNLVSDDEGSGNAVSESNKSSASEPAVKEKPVKEEKAKKEKSAPTASGSTVKAGKPAPAEDFMVKLTDNGVEITGYTGSAKNLTIPATIEDLPVVSVSVSKIECEQIFVPEGVIYVSFPESKNLRAISLPSTLKEIGDFKTSGIRSIVIPASVKKIIGDSFWKCNDLITAEISGDNLKWYRAFIQCEALQTAIIHEGVTEIASLAFIYCKALRNLTLPSSLESIGDGSFTECSSLTSVVIPNGVTYIGREAFQGCISLTSVTIPKSVTRIGEEAFRGCVNLVTVDIEEGTSFRSYSDSFPQSGKLNLKSQAAIKAASRN